MMFKFMVIKYEALITSVFVSLISWGLFSILAESLLLGFIPASLFFVIIYPMINKAINKLNNKE